MLSKQTTKRNYLIELIFIVLCGDWSAWQFLQKRKKMGGKGDEEVETGTFKGRILEEEVEKDSEG